MLIYASSDILETICFETEAETKTAYFIYNKLDFHENNALPAYLPAKPQGHSDGGSDMLTTSSQLTRIG